jgi:N-acetylglucosaminyldiphosphoundecaprenol N-acetyl-beta-D-mannosaminyltransferase
MSEAIDEIATLVTDGRRYRRQHSVATVNVDFLVNAHRDPDVRALLHNTTLNIADGLPVVWGSKLARLPIRERVAGADLVPNLVAEATIRDWRIHFFGSAPGVAERAVELLRERHPGVSLSGSSGPLMKDVALIDDDVLADIEECDPDILCVALGNPKQERFIATHGARLGTPVMIGIGGSLDLLVGDKRRAPSWAQRIGAEWIFRAAQEPARLGRRYARDAVVFLPMLAAYLLRLRRLRCGLELTVEVRDDMVRVATSAGDGGAVSFGAAARRLGNGLRLEVDLEQGLPNPRALCGILGLMRYARRSGSHPHVSGLSVDDRAKLTALAVPGWSLDCDRGSDR